MISEAIDRLVELHGSFWKQYLLRTICSPILYRIISYFGKYEIIKNYLLHFVNEQCSPEMLRKLLRAHSRKCNVATERKFPRTPWWTGLRLWGSTGCIRDAR